MPDESTTPDPEEAARRLREAFSRGDFDAVVAMYTSDAVLDPSLLGLGVNEGRDAIRAVYEEVHAPFEDFKLVGEEFRDLGNGMTLAVTLARGRPRGSARFVETRKTTVAIWANGLIERTTWYTDIDEARAAAERLARNGGRRCRSRIWT